MEDWKFYKEIDFSDENIKQYHIDTRDFHVICNTEKKDINFANLHRKPKSYIYTPEELKNLIDRYYTESGGENDWRMFTLSGSGKEWTSGWQLKYIRCYRVDGGLVICDGVDYCYRKEILDNKVEQECLHAHTIKRNI